MISKNGVDVLDASQITSGRFDKTRLEATLDKLLKGAGVGVDPTEIAVPGPTIVRKTADQIVNNSTVLVNDEHLLFAIAANEVWEFTLYLWANSPTVPDIKIGATIPNGAVGQWLINGYATDSNPTYQTISAFAPTALGGTNANTLTAVIKGLIINGETAGNFQFQFAQSAAAESDTKVLTNSCIIARKLA